MMNLDYGAMFRGIKARECDADISLIKRKKMPTHASCLHIQDTCIKFLVQF